MTVKRKPVATNGDLTGHVGAELRRLRLDRGLSLQQVADRAGLSVGFVSQAERGLSALSIKALQNLGAALGKPVGWFFREDIVTEAQDESDVIVRRGRRKRLEHAGLGIVDFLLTPSLDGQLEVLLCEFEPGATSGEEPYTHAGEECGVLLSGRLELWVGERFFLLKAGDSFAFPSTTPHRYRNPGRGRTRIIWTITPPSY